MTGKSPRLGRDAPLDHVIAVLNGLSERVDGIEGCMPQFGEPITPKARSIEPVVRIVGSMLIVEGSDHTVETRIHMPSEGMPYAALIQSLRFATV